jgi:hypothetical protein
MKEAYCVPSGRRQEASMSCLGRSRTLMVSLLIRSMCLDSVESTGVLELNSMSQIDAALRYG